MRALTLLELHNFTSEMLVGKLSCIIQHLQSLATIFAGKSSPDPLLYNSIPEVKTASTISLNTYVTSFSWVRDKSAIPTEV
jgi:hypothetical protein